MAKNKPNLVRLNLGCGSDRLSGFVNVDIDPSLKPDQVVDLRKKLPYEANSVQEIMLQDVLEHLTKEDGFALLRECARILRFGGKLTVRVPSPTAIIRKFRWQTDLQMLYLYGDTSKNGEWGAHKYGYSPNLWRETLSLFNLQSISEKTIDTNYLFVAKKLRLLPEKKTRYCTSLLEFISTPWYVVKGEKVIWKIEKPYPSLLGKIVLRPLAFLVSRIEVTSDVGYEFVCQVLKYSHLRIRKQN